MNTKNFYKHFMLLAGIFLMVACNPPREAGIRDRAGNELSDFRSWVSNTVSRADDATEEERASIRQEFQQLSARAGNSLSELTNDARTEFARLTARYEDWDAEQDRKMMARKQQQEQNAMVQGGQMTEKLLDAPFRNVNSLTASQVRDAYISFMENVRDNRKDWSEKDWELVEQVLKQLNNRKEQVNEGLSTKDQAKILALQAEFQLLQSGQQIKEEIKN
jgi:Tfp pilus assembly protein PilP